MIPTRIKSVDNELMAEEIRKLISEGNAPTFTVRGNSMNPMIVDRRDSMTLGPWTDSDLRKGCVAFVRDTLYVGNEAEIIGRGQIKCCRKLA